jgi:6-pyruvoyltetrahydropterin/6-carboxytetrahydropterin synthase
VDPSTGWFIDYALIDSAWAPLYERLDHHYLNEVDGLDNPTSENLARWVWAQLKPSLPMLSRVTVFETCDCRCEYDGQ